MPIFIAFSTPIDSSCEAFSLFGAPISNPAPNGFRQRAQTHDFEFTKPLDNLSRAFLLAAGQGSHLEWVWIEMYRMYFGPPYLTFKLKDVVISSYQIRASAGSGAEPEEVIGMNYENMIWELG